MLNDIQVEDYADDIELLQKVDWRSYEYRGKESTF
jgi:hypothetical protein